MSTTVVPAPATQAQRLDRSEKLAEQTEKQQAAQNEERLAEDDSNVESVSEEVADAKAEAKGEKEISVSETSLAGSFAFEGALADAAATLTVEAKEADEEGLAQFGEGGSGTILLVAAIALVGIGIAALASGDSDGDSPDVPTNEDPSIDSVALDGDSVDEDGAGTITVTASDPDGDTLTTTVTAANGTITDNGDGTYGYAPDADFNGTDTITVSVDDGNGGTASSTLDVTVNPVDDAPTGAATQAITTDEDTEVAGAATITDADGDALTFSISTPATNGIVVLAADGSFTYTPAQDYNGDDSFAITASDGTSEFTQDITVTVNPVNDAPAFGAETADVELTNQETFTNVLAATDVDGDDLTFALDTAAASGTATVAANGAITYVPNDGFVGTDTIVVSVSDGELTDTATINFIVTDGPPNNAPVFGAEAVAITVTEGEVFNATLDGTAVDPDGDPLTFALDTQATNGTAVVNADGTYSYTPADGFTGTDSYIVAVSDDRGGTDTLTVNVTVEPVVLFTELAIDNSDAGLQDFLGLTDVAPDGSIVALDAGTAYVLGEDAQSRTDLVLQNFNADDVIMVENATLNLYSFGTGVADPNDLRITLNAGGNFTNLIIDDALVGYDGFIFDYDDAVAALGFDFMNFA